MPMLPHPVSPYEDAFSHERSLIRVLGNIALPQRLRDHVDTVAREYWSRQVESDFSDQVEVMRPPRGYRSLSWFPQDAVSALGLARERRGDGHEWVMTTDVDPHEDDAWGLTLLWVLKNPGLVFEQHGFEPIVPAEGDWFVFDDRVEHAVAPGPTTPDEGVFLAWAVRLRLRQRRAPARSAMPEVSSTRAGILEERAAGPGHQVVTVRSSSKSYRRRPCAGCPWRLENAGSFPAEAFRHSARTAYDMSEHVFACHESGVEKTQACAGFLLRGAEHNLAVRVGYSQGRYQADVSDGGARLHGSYREMAIANGVDADDAVLAACRP